MRSDQSSRGKHRKDQRPKEKKIKGSEIREKYRSDQRSKKKKKRASHFTPFFALTMI